MREIKFRAWDRKDERMIVHEQEFIPLKVTSAGVFRLNPHHEENLYFLIDPKRFILMQYTGLKDENSADVYEDDIVKYGTLYHGKVTHILTGKIVYNEFCGAFQIAYKNINDVFITDFIHQFKILKVIGNIHKYPELLDET